MSEVIVVTSGKGGVGKTTTSANVGTGLAEMGKSVVLIDADIGLRNLDVVMGLENRIVYNLVDVIEGNCRLKQALIKDKRHAGLFLMPAAQTRDKNCITPGQMVKLIDSLREQFDYIILDCPAGIEQGFQNAIAGADHAIVVTTPEVSAIRDADRIIGLLEANEIKKVDLPQKKAEEIGFAEYTVCYRTAAAIPALEGYNALASAPAEKKSKRGVRSIELKEHLPKIDYQTAEGGEGAVFSVRLPASEALNLNPALLTGFLQQRFGLPAQAAGILRTALYTKDGTPFL